MRTNCCHGFIALNFKFFNLVQLFVGISMVVYSLYMLNQWHDRAPVAPPPSVAPAPDSPDFRFYGLEATAFGDRIDPLFLAADMVSGSDELPDLGFSDLPATWFIYCFMGVGVVLCTVSCIGYVAAEAINGCCLCFYNILITVLLMLEGSMVAFIVLDRSWEKVLPSDPTGELESLKDFIKENADLCKCVGLAFLAVQGISLLLGFVLKAMVTPQRTKSDIEDNYVSPRDGNREPLLRTQPGQASGSVKGEVRANLSDIWTSRMREKYGLHYGNSKYTTNQNPPGKDDILVHAEISRTPQRESLG